MIDKIDDSNLLTSSVVPREQTFYLVTEDDLRSIGRKKLMVNIFMILASVTLAAFLSAIITKAAAKLPEATLLFIDTYQWFFFGLGVIFTVLAIFFNYQINSIISTLQSAEEVELTSE